MSCRLAARPEQSYRVGKHMLPHTWKHLYWYWIQQGQKWQWNTGKVSITVLGGGVYRDTVTFFSMGKLTAFH